MKRAWLFTMYVVLLSIFSAVNDQGPARAIRASGCPGTSAQAWAWVDDERYATQPICVPTPTGWSRLTDAYVDRRVAGYGAGAEGAVYSPV